MGIRNNIYDLDRDLAMELHKQMWKRMLKKAKSGKFPLKNNILQEMGYVSQMMVCDCFLCTYGWMQVLKLREGEEHDQLIRHTEEGSHKQCDWCPYKFTKDDSCTTPCTAEDSPFRNYDIIKAELQMGHINEEFACKEVAGYCKKMLELEEVHAS